MRPQYERRSPAPTLEFNLSADLNLFFNGSEDEGAKARAAPSGAASEGVQNTHPTISRGNNLGTAPVSSFWWVPDSLQQIFGGNSSQPPGMRSFPAGSLGRSDGLVSGLLNVEEYATRKTDNFMRQLKRETWANEPPFPDLLDPFGKLFK